jgi:hypothetical protein
MNENTDFDVVVLGESPAGLWAAKKLLARGKKIMVIATGTSRHHSSLPKFMVEDFELQKFLPIDRAEKPLQILTPDRRVRLFTDEKRFQEEYTFQFGVPFSLTAKPDPSFLRGLAHWVRGSETAPVFPDEWPGLYSRIFETFYFDEGPTFVTQTLLTDLERSGATIVKPGSLRRIFVDRKFFVGVQLSQSSKMISVKQALMNTHFDYLNSFMNEPFPFLSRPLGWKFQMSFECSSDSLPIGLTNRMIYVEEKAPILEFFQAKPGVFHLQTVLPLNEESLNRGEQRRIAARMLKVCESILPDLEYNIRKIVPDLRDPERAMNTDLPALYPFQELKRIPPSLLTYGGGASSIPISPTQGVWVTHEEASPREDIWGGFEGARAALKGLEANASAK